MASLCETCQHMREVRTARSRFLLCEPSTTNANYPKYPPQPVIRCAGYQLREDAGAMQVDRQEIAEAWAARGFGCDLWTDPPGQCWEDFTHPTDELVCVLEGQVEFEIGVQVSQPRPGEELLIPAGVVHSVRNKGKTTAIWLYGYKTK